MQPNRLETHWSYIERKLRQQYPRVPEAMWDRTEGQFDKIVTLITKTYVPGRASITVEAEVRDNLLQWVGQAEHLE